ADQWFPDPKEPSTEEFAASGIHSAMPRVTFADPGIRTVTRLNRQFDNTRTGRIAEKLVKVEDAGERVHSIPARFAYLLVIDDNLVEPEGKVNVSNCKQRSLAETR